MHWAWMSERYLISTTCLTGACACGSCSQNAGRGLSGLPSPEGRLWGQRPCQGLAPSPSSSGAQGVCGRGQGQGRGKLGSSGRRDCTCKVS